MGKVTYTGTSGALGHHNNPSGTHYVFQAGIPLEVKPGDAEWYAEEATRGGPWKVDLGVVEKVAETVKRTKGGKK